MVTEILIAIGVILASLILIMIATFAKGYKKTNAKAESVGEERLDNDPITEKMRVTVKAVNCSVKSGGFRSPELSEEYYITFESEDGEIFSIYVDEGACCGFEEGQAGVLTLVDGQLSSFISEGSQDE